LGVDACLLDQASFSLGLNRPQIAKKVLRQRVKKLREENHNLKEQIRRLQRENETIIERLEEKSSVSNMLGKLLQNKPHRRK